VTTLPVTERDVFGLVRATVDAHTLGLSSVAQLLEECGLRVVMAEASVCEAAGQSGRADSAAILERWVRDHGITRLGFSYRLDPGDGAELFGALCRRLRERRLLAGEGGPLKSLCFAGLPAACARVRREQPDSVAVFQGDETPGETLTRLGVPPSLRPAGMTEEIAYDDTRLTFARDLLRGEKPLRETAVDRSAYPGIGTAQDRLVSRVAHSIGRGQPPVMRAHVGPYSPNRLEAVHLFLDWCRQLAATGFLDVLSVGTSQLTQSKFGEEWGDAPNGGGVPLNSPEEFRAVWDVSRPMLVRTYAGTNRLPELARLYEATINNAWHALSLWWFCQVDGRGPLTVRDNLRQQFETLEVVAGSGKPYEPNVPHHFAFRGADDVTYVVSAVLAARAAKQLGIRHLVLQNMLNTPKGTWGVQDLAKARTLLTLTRELEDPGFKVYLQPRAGLDYFSPDLEKAKVQLAAVTALMDDIEPHDVTSPPIIHVVSYSEGSHLAEPAVVNESVQITRAALREYRRLRASGDMADMSAHPEVLTRTEGMLSGARAVLRAIEQCIPEPYTPRGLYDAFAAGFLPVPHLWECRQEFPNAVQWRTRLMRGGVHVVNAAGQPVPPKARASLTAAEAARTRR